LGERGGGEQEGCAEERDGPEVHGFTFVDWLRRCRSTSLLGDGEDGQLRGMACVGFAIWDQKQLIH
jgi:hypothetical protein